jgi:hypothetical protein
MVAAASQDAALLPIGQFLQIRVQNLQGLGFRVP